MDYDFSLIEHQEQFVIDPSRYLLNSGGVGSGKSYALIFKTLKLLIDYPGIRILITDNNWPSLRDTTYYSFQELVPDELILKHNRSTHQFDIINGSMVIFRAFDNPKKLKRYTFGAIGCEELSDISEEFFKMARTRLRQPGYPGVFFAATNPSTFQNWVYRVFIKDPIPGSKVIFSNTYDNIELDDAYIHDMDSIKEVDEAYHRRMVKGEWGTLEGLIYELPEDQRTIPEREGKYDLYLCGVDFGFTHPTAIVVIGVHGDSFDILEEIYEQYLTSDDIMEYLKPLHRRYLFHGIFADSSRPEIIQDIDDAGLPGRASRKGAGSIFAGVMKIKSLIKKKLLHVSPLCENVLKEIDSYIWGTPRESEKYESPKDENNHALDAIRYAIYTYLREDAGDLELDEILRIQKIL